MNTGALALYGSFSITAQDNGTDSFAFGTPLHKVGRTTGWTQGTVLNTCVRVNVSGSNIQLLCQTLVFNGAEQWPIIMNHMRTRQDLTKSDAEAVAAFLQQLAERASP